MDSKRKIWFAAGLTLFFLVVGTLGYSKLEGFSPLDAFYMTVITISTVGFGEINELTEVGRIFTIFLILSGVGSVAFAAHAFTESIIENASNPNLRKKAMQKKIDRLQGHCIICGHGRVGAAAADHFHSKGADFIVIEMGEEQSKIIEKKGYMVLLGDATSESTLLDAGIKKAGSLLALLDSDPENLFTVLTARELNPTLHIIARTRVSSSESRILKAGADAVISPYASAGKRVADKILTVSQNQTVLGFDGADSIYVDELLKVNEKSGLIGKLVQAANDILHGQILGIKREGGDTLLPDANFILEEGDEVLFAKSSRPRVADKKNEKKIVLIDDNPVIRRLYTRLFQKAGYNIMIAENGEQGYSLILAERPDVAVVDYMLPDISGLEVCRRLRQNSDADATRLILFTADEQDSTKEKALRDGVEQVVVKSPEASEIISIVENTLERY